MSLNSTILRDNFIRFLPNIKDASARYSINNHFYYAIIIYWEFQTFWEPVKILLVLIFFDKLLTFFISKFSLLICRQISFWFWGNRNYGWGSAKWGKIVSSKISAWELHNPYYHWPQCFYLPNIHHYVQNM